MNFLPALYSAFALLLTLVSASDLKVRNSRFVQIHDLVNATYLNGSYAIITGEPLESGRLPILTVNESEILSFDCMEKFNSSNFFTRVTVKPENTMPFQWVQPRERTLEEVLADSDFSIGRIGSQWEPTELSEDQKEELKLVASFLWKLCGGKPGRLLDDDKFEYMARAVGGWLCQKYGFTGMVFTADHIPRMTEYLARAWDLIGVFSA